MKVLFAFSIRVVEQGQQVFGIPPLWFLSSHVCGELKAEGGLVKQTR